jgi:hypothetical protein
MADTWFLTPVEGKTVLDENGNQLPAGGASMPRTAYWIKRLREGVVTSDAYYPEGPQHPDETHPDVNAHLTALQNELNALKTTQLTTEQVQQLIADSAGSATAATGYSLTNAVYPHPDVTGPVILNPLTTDAEQAQVAPSFSSANNYASYQFSNNTSIALPSQLPGSLMASHDNEVGLTKVSVFGAFDVEASGSNTYLVPGTDFKRSNKSFFELKTNYLSLLAETHSGRRWHQNSSKALVLTKTNADSYNCAVQSYSITNDDMVASGKIQPLFLNKTLSFSNYDIDKFVLINHGPARVLLQALHIVYHN